jgi:hypothetical protein
MMATATRAITGEEFFDLVGEALGLDPNTVFRFIIDAQLWEPVKVYVEMIASSKILDVNLSKIPFEIEIIDKGE